LTDKAYFEVSIREEIFPLFKKYKGEKYLFDFSKRFGNSDYFSEVVNRSMGSLCQKAGVQKITVY
jgi:hypothetical protein